MAKLNENYEAMIIFSLKEGEEKVKTLEEKFKKLIEQNGTLENIDEWGKRKLAYEINYETEGYYVLYTFTSKSEFPAELDRVLKITDGVMRSMTTVKMPEAAK
ncbi:MAG: 30S ribosomal protein S6 [Oscillospiraceae bacterium]|jgi:small subunit ribosomal protein S6|nr:30S ribosomal protein S6 [Oscillospiraceae bacterium]MCR5166238.1 30S ribosomal protein S6 [Oscillospiraceae bacterium]